MIETTGEISIMEYPADGMAGICSSTRSASQKTSVKSNKYEAEKCMCKQSRDVVVLQVVIVAAEGYYALPMFEFARGFSFKKGRVRRRPWERRRVITR